MCRSRALQQGGACASAHGSVFCSFCLCHHRRRPPIQARSCIDSFQSSLLFRSGQYLDGGSFCMSNSKPHVRVTIADVVSDGEGITRYRLQVSTDCCRWDVLKRYSEIDLLKKSLLPKFNSVRSSDRFFPPKKVLSDESTVRERKELFQTWFAAICSDTNVICDASVLFFLQIDNMWRAIDAGDARYVELLLSARVALSHHPHDPDLFPLHHICKKGFFACAETLLHSMSPKERSSWLSKLDSSGMSPLHIAVVQGHITLVSLLLRHGASPALNSRSAATPLHVSLQHRRMDIMSELVSAIAVHGDVALLDTEDKKGRSALHYAVHFRMRDAVQLLLKSGASIAHAEQQTRLSVAERHRSGHTVLHVTAAMNDRDMLRVLFAHVRQYNATQGASVPSIDKLALLSQTNAAGYTALHVAAAASASECILELLDNGALVDLTDIFGNSPLHVMVAASDSEYSVLLLLSHRADPNLCNDDGNSALHIAALHNHHRSLQQLLLHGGDPTALNVFGLSPHILAVRRCSVECLELLQGNGFAISNALPPSPVGSACKRSQMLTWGFGSDGRLGHGEEQSLWEPVSLEHEAVPSFVHVSVGGQMTAAADSSGKVYTWGCGGSKRLGHNSFSNELVPRVVQALAGVFVTRVTCGHLHAAAVTSVGSIFTWGDGEFGKLGHGNTDSVSAPTFCRFMRECTVDIACGRDHTLALTSKGLLFAWGCNKDGRLGLGHTQTLYEPDSIPLHGLVATCVSAGWDHSGAVVDGRVYTWGRGVKGQLGDGLRQSKKMPFRVNFPDDATLTTPSFVSLKCGSFFTVALSIDGRVFTWGDANEGKLGLISAASPRTPCAAPVSSPLTSPRDFHGSSSEEVVPAGISALHARDTVGSSFSPSSPFDAPQELPEFGPCPHQMFALEIACGSSHTLVRTRCDNVCCWGTGLAGQLGLGRLLNFSSVPAVLPKLARAGVTQLSAALAHSCCLVCPPSGADSDAFRSPGRPASMSSASAASPPIKTVKRERGDSWKLMQHLAETLDVPVSVADDAESSTTPALKQQGDESDLQTKTQSPLPSPLVSRSISRDMFPSPAAEAETIDGAGSFQDVDVHRLSRMVLQSLHFSDVSPQSEDPPPSSTFASCATGSNQLPHGTQQSDPS